MVRLMEETNSEGLNKSQHPKLKNRQLLDVFTHLADGKEDRQTCTDRLVTYIQGAEEASTEEGLNHETKYSVRRLVQGLSSDRQVARLGYSVALCQWLRVSKTVNNEVLFKFIEESAQMHGTHGNSKKSIRNARIGKVFAYLVMVQSQKLFEGENDQIAKVVKDLSIRNARIGKVFAYLVMVQSQKLFEGENGQIAKVVKDLVKMSAEKDYLAHLCSVALSQIISKVKHKVFQKYILPEIEDKLTAGWAGCSPDDLLLIINLKKYHAKVCSQHLTDKWEDKDVISTTTFRHLGEIFKKTSKLFPVIHSVIDATISEVTEQELDLTEFWKTAICPLFDERTRFSTHSIGVHIFDNLIPHIQKLKPAQVEEIIFPSITSEVAHHNKDAVAKVMTFVKVTSDSQIQLTVLKCFVRQMDEPHDKIINDVINHLVPEAFVRLKKELVKCYIMKSSWISGKESLSNWYKWCVVILDNMVTKQDELSWQLDVLQFLFVHSFFTVQKTTDLPHCKPLSEQHEDPVRTATSQHFFKALTRLLSYNQKGMPRSTQFNKHLDVLYQLAQYAEALLQKSDCVQLHSKDFSEQARGQWTKMMELLPTLQKKRSSSEKLGLHHAFELLFIYGGLQLFSDSTAVEILQELHMCYKKSNQRRKSKVSEEEPEWIEVVTELLLSFMVKGSNLARNIAKTAMETLVDHVTTEALQLILDALQQKSADEEEGMLGMEDDGKTSNSEDEPGSEEDETMADADGDVDDDNDDDDAHSGDESDESDDDDDNDDDDDDVKNSLKNPGKDKKSIKKTPMMNGEVKKVNAADEIDDDDDDDDQDSGVEEEDGINVADDVKKKIKEALGEAAVDSDESSEGEEEEMSDSDMFQLDEQLAKAFKAMSSTNRKQEEKEKKEQLVLFKVRTCDLLDVIVRKNPSVHLMKEMVLPILDMILPTQHLEKEQALFNKIRDIFDQMYKTKKMTVDVQVDKEELLEMFKELMKLSTKKIPGDKMNDVIKACALVVKMILTLEGHAAPSPVKTRSKRRVEKETTKKSEDYHDKVVSLVQNGLKDSFVQKSGQLSVSFYSRLLERNSFMFWPVWEGLLEIICLPDLKTHSKADAVIILTRVLRKELVQQLGSEEWNLFITEVKKTAKTVMKTVTANDKHFTKELLNLFIKIYQVSPDSSFKLLQDEDMEKLEKMIPDLKRETINLLRRVYRYMYKKELPNIKQKRKNETPNVENSSPNKKAKTDNQSVSFPNKKAKTDNQSVTNGNQSVSNGNPDSESVANGNLGSDDNLTNETSENGKMKGKKQKNNKRKRKSSMNFNDLETSLASPTKTVESPKPCSLIVTEKGDSDVNLTASQKKKQKKKKQK